MNNFTIQEQINADVELDRRTLSEATQPRNCPSSSLERAYRFLYAIVRR